MTEVYSTHDLFLMLTALRRFVQKPSEVFSALTVILSGVRFLVRRTVGFFSAPCHGCGDKCRLRQYEHVLVFATYEEHVPRTGEEVLYLVEELNNRTLLR